VPLPGVAGTARDTVGMGQQQEPEDDGRRPPGVRVGSHSRWWEEGEEPDYRATLANERTFLSWSRTSLALLAGALAVLRLTDLAPYALRLALASYLVLVSLATAVAGYVQWRTRQECMRRGESLGHTRAQAALLLALVVLVGLAVATVITSPA
jgi:putative membrane protein